MQDAAAIVAAMVREFDFPRYAAALHAPPIARRGLLALAAFDLEILRIPDQVSQPLPGEVRLQWWSDALEGTEHGSITGHPVAAELLWAVATFGLSRDTLLGLVNAHKFDLYDDAMPSREALDVYCDDTVGALMAASAAILGERSPAEALRRDAGRALGLTRLLARLPHDAARRRCFVPDDLLQEHDASRQQMLAADDTPGLRAARDGLIARARFCAVRAVEGLKRLPRAQRPAFLAVTTLRRELDAIAQSEPFALVPPLSRLRVLWTQWQAMR